MLYCIRSCQFVVSYYVCELTSLRALTYFYLPFLCGEGVKKEKWCYICILIDSQMNEALLSPSLLPISWDQLSSTMHTCFLQIRKKRLDRPRPAGLEVGCWQQRSMKVQDPSLLSISCKCDSFLSFLFLSLFLVVYCLFFSQQLLEFPFPYQPNMRVFF